MLYFIFLFFAAFFVVAIDSISWLREIDGSNFHAERRVRSKNIHADVFKRHLKDQSLRDTWMMRIWWEKDVVALF